MSKTSLSDIIGANYTKLGFFREAQEKMAELQTYNRELQKKRQEIQNILNGIMDVLAVITPDYRISFVNSIFHDYFSESEPCGHYCYKVFRYRDRPCPVCPLRDALDSGEIRRGFYANTRHGNKVCFEMLASPIQDNNGAISSVLVSKRDVTREKEYQAKYYQAEKMATIGLLAAGVAHEINNPLATISGFAEGLKRRLPRLRHCLEKAHPDLVDDVEEYTQTILEECNRCRDSVVNLLSFGSTKCSRAVPTNLNTLVTDTLSILGHEIKRYPTVTLHQDLWAHPLWLKTAPGELKQVILNLLMNALDAVKETQHALISITTTKHRGCAVLLVRDNGHGIDPETQQKLFFPFFTTKTQGHSIGIGLSICYNIITRHGGEIHVCSEPGEGAAFRVLLPLDQAEQRELS